MRDKLYRFMQGRNGMDDLCRMESGLVLVLLILGIFTRLGIFTTVALLLMIHMYYRALSKNTAKRYEVRVPKGHGKIEITCPKCREKFIRRS